MTQSFHSRIHPPLKFKIESEPCCNFHCYIQFKKNTFLIRFYFLNDAGCYIFHRYFFKHFFHRILRFQ